MIRSVEEKVISASSLFTTSWSFSISRTTLITPLHPQPFHEQGIFLTSDKILFVLVPRENKQNNDDEHTKVFFVYFFLKYFFVVLSRICTNVEFATLYTGKIVIATV
jgi:hypothetical protein